MASITFNYTGGEVQWQVPNNLVGTTIGVDAAGGEGGGYDNHTSVAPGGKGGRVQLTLTVTPGESLRLRVGGKGQDGDSTAGTARTGAYFGGANGGGPNATGAVGGAGGGESDIRRGGSAESNRVVVAAGGGGEPSGTHNSTTKDGGATLDSESVTASAATAGATESDAPR